MSSWLHPETGRDLAQSFSAEGVMHLVVVDSDPAYATQVAAALATLAEQTPR